MTNEGEGLAGALRRARAAAGLSQPEAARKAKIHKVTLSRYENGHRTPDADDLGRLASAYGVTVGQLVGEDNRTDTATGTTKPATSETGGLGAGDGHTPDWWLGYWQSKQETIHDTLMNLSGLQSHLTAELQRAIQMHQQVLANTVPTPRRDLTPEQREHVETVHGLLAAKEKAEREQAGGKPDAERPAQPAKRPKRRRASGSGG